MRRVQSPFAAGEEVAGTATFGRDRALNGAWGVAEAHEAGAAARCRKPPAAVQIDWAAAAAAGVAAARRRPAVRGRLALAHPASAVRTSKTAAAFAARPFQHLVSVEPIISGSEIPKCCRKRKLRQPALQGPECPTCANIPNRNQPLPVSREARHDDVIAPRLFKATAHASPSSRYSLSSLRCRRRTRPAPKTQAAAPAARPRRSRNSRSSSRPSRRACRI